MPGRISSKPFAVQYEEVIARVEDTLVKLDVAAASLRKTLRQLKRADVPVSEPPKTTP